MFQDILVGLPLAVLQAVEVGRIWFALIAGFEMREVALDVAGCTAASGSGETDVRRHGCFLRREEGSVAFVEVVFGIGVWFWELYLEEAELSIEIRLWILKAVYS